MNYQEKFYKKVKNLLENGIQPKIRIREMYYDEGFDIGFTCLITGSNDKEFDCYSYNLLIPNDLVELNKSFANTEWYDKKGKVTLSFFDVSKKLTDTAYIEKTDNTIYFEFVTKKQEKLYNTYLANKKDKSYLTWLEERVLMINKLNDYVN